MKSKVFTHKHYDIEIDPTTNRMYLTLKGFWKKREEVENYSQDIRKAAAGLEKGYQLVADLRLLLPPPVEMNQVHEQAQKTLLDTGLSVTAEVLENIVVKSVTGTIAKNSKMPKREFKTMEEAEEWLDNVEVNE